MTGEKASFDSSKLSLSLERSGASDMVISQIIAEVEGMEPYRHGRMMNEINQLFNNGRNL